MKTIDNDKLNEMIWSQLGASIDMLEGALRACPDEHWSTGPEFQQFWYLSYHTLFFLDYNMYGNPSTYAPKPPFGLTELDPSGVLPDRVYTRHELLEYLSYCRNQCRLIVRSMTVEQGFAMCPFPERKLTWYEWLLKELRHVQHHTAQLNLRLRQSIDDAPLWVSRSKYPFHDEV